MILTVGYIFNYSIFTILFAVLSQVYSLGRLPFLDSLMRGDSIGCISDILYTDIEKQCALFYYI